MSEIENLARTIARLARPDMRPKQLIEAVREEHPKASKKDIVRAAFYAVIVSADKDPVQARRLHKFALEQRRGPSPITETDRQLGKPKPERSRLTAAKVGNPTCRMLSRLAA
jgi:hypothetical protein